MGSSYKLSPAVVSLIWCTCFSVSGLYKLQIRETRYVHVFTKSTTFRRGRGSNNFKSLNFITISLNVLHAVPLRLR